MALGYQSDYTDPTSGDVWMGARWYQPGSATFTARDSYFGMLAEPLSLNRYTYATGNPLNFFDPDGHRIEDCGETCASRPAYSSPALDADEGEAHRLASQTRDSEAHIAEQRALGAADRRAQRDVAPVCGRDCREVRKERIRARGAAEVAQIRADNCVLCKKGLSGIAVDTAIESVNLAVRVTTQEPSCTEQPIMRDKQGNPLRDNHGKTIGGECVPLQIGIIVLLPEEEFGGPSEGPGKGGCSAGILIPPMDGLFEGGRIPKESELHKYAQEQGWKLRKTPTGPPTFVDENGVERLVLKSPSSIAPGSNYPRVEAKDATGHRIDPIDGSKVVRKSDGNHREYRAGC